MSNLAKGAVIGAAPVEVSEGSEMVLDNPGRAVSGVIGTSPSLPVCRGVIGSKEISTLSLSSLSEEEDGIEVEEAVETVEQREGVRECRPSVWDETDPSRKREYWGFILDRYER